MRNFLFRVGSAPHMEEHHLANHVADMPAGISIVADVGNAVLRKAFRADGENAVAHRIGYPGINAVRDDIVERHARLQRTPSDPVAEAGHCQ